MLNKIKIMNFRSNEETEVAFSSINVLYGATSSGKSTLLYALMVLRNFVLNPGRQADAFFHVGFMDLGGFEACVFDHDTTRRIMISAEFKYMSDVITYEISLSKISAQITQRWKDVEMTAEVSLPYQSNQSFTFEYSDEQEEYTIAWNGIISNVTPKKPNVETQQKAQKLAVLLNKPNEFLKAIDIAPHKRGFFKPNYSPTPVSLIPTSEDEVATIIINDQHLPGRISTYAEDIFGRDFRTYVPPGTATAYFHSTDKKSRIPVFLVNEGFGVNQIIYLLAKMVRIDVDTLLIEEPEVHLHPTVVRRFARTLCTFVQEEKKQIILATHSEQFLISLLSAVREGVIKANEIRCYLATKEKKVTKFDEQKVDSDGQITGGMASFMEGELEDFKSFLNVK